MRLIFAVSVVALSNFSGPVVAQQSSSEDMSFEDCLLIIRRTSEQLGVSHKKIVETDELRIVRYETSDGSVLVTCSRPDGKMVLTVSN